jgi:adenosylcobinamide-phosphate synthase
MGIPLGYQILLAFLLDLLVGDPRWLPHPVKWIGRLALLLESPARRIWKNQKVAGIMVAGSVVFLTAAIGYGLIFTARAVHPLVGDVVGVLILYTGIAARDMMRHSTDVQSALEARDMPEAARRVGMICGRDTDRLDEAGIVRATVESVAENMVDGVTAPLFFAALGGPVLMLVYKAVSTLDSTFGYKNEQYAQFGWASARLDDAFNFVPARCTALLVPVAALILGLRPVSSVRIFLRDRLKHPSPNSGHTEAAFAGAIGIRLGGLGYYGGTPSLKPTLGDALCLEEPQHIRTANVLMLATSSLALALLLVIRAMVR